MQKLHDIITDPETIQERLIQVIMFPIMFLLLILAFAFLVSYFLFGLFILDGIYYIITGNTIVAKHLKS